MQFVVDAEESTHLQEQNEDITSDATEGEDEEEDEDCTAVVPQNPVLEALFKVVSD